MIRAHKGTPNQNAARTLAAGAMLAVLILVIGNAVAPPRDPAPDNKTAHQMGDAP